MKFDDFLDESCSYSLMILTHLCFNRASMIGQRRSTPGFTSKHNAQY